MKFFLDAHYAPYKDEHRYWPGLLLLVQCILLSITALAGPSVVLLAISTATLGIATWVWNFGSVFKFWYLNALEGSFILNLGVLAAGTHYLRHAGGSQAALINASIAFAFVAFIGIVIYHIHLQVRDFGLLRLIKKFYWPERARQNGVRSSQEAEEETTLLGQRMSSSVDFSQPREPLLESQFQD